MRVPTLRDYSKIPEFLAGEWPKPFPPHVMYEDPEAYAHIDAMAKAPFTVVDTEYTYDVETDRPIQVYQVGFYAPGGPAVIWDRESTGSAMLEEVYLDVMKIACAGQLVLQNGAADIEALHLPIDIRHDDPVLGHHCLYSEWKHNLMFLESLYGQHARAKHLGPGSYEYLVGDVVTTALSWQAMLDEFEHDPESYEFYKKYMLPLTPILIDFNRRGLPVDQEFVERKYAEYTEKIEAAQRIAEAHCGFPINLDSGPQLSKHLAEVDAVFKETKRRPKKTKTGRISVSDDIVADLRDAYLPRDEDEPFTEAYLLDRIERGAQPLLEARAGFIASRQLRSMALDPLRGKYRIYPRYLPFAQANYRWSSLSPNIGQYPSDLLSIFHPEPGWSLIKFDWNAIEGRIEALMAGDEAMLEVFRNDWDFHTINMCEGLGYPLPANLEDPHRAPEDAQWRELLTWEGKDDPRRVFFKRIVFRLFYGAMTRTAPGTPGADLLKAKIEAVTRRDLDFEPEAPLPKERRYDKRELVAVSETWLSKHPALRRLWARLEREAVTNGYVRTIAGNKRVMFDRDHKRRIRVAYDFPMQGLVAKIMNETVIALWDLTRGKDGHLAYTRHDSIAWFLPTEHVEELMPTIREVTQPFLTHGGNTLQLTATYEVVHGGQNAESH